MAMWQVFFTGMMTALMPSLLVLLILLRSAPTMKQKEPTMNIDRLVLVRVYRLPEVLTDGFCFGTGIPITFRNVDWFEAPLTMDVGSLIDFIKAKPYYEAHARFLVLGDDPLFVFVIERELSNGVL